MNESAEPGRPADDDTDPMTQHRFEVAIYNEAVKKAVREADPNKTGLSDDWADTRYIEIRAESADAARRRVYARYPEHRGFVVLEVRQLD